MRSHISPHKLRKFHASQLLQGKNRMTIDEIDTLQGRAKKKTHQSYYYNDEEDLRQKYIQNLEHLLINTQITEVKINDPEVQKLLDENIRLKGQVDELEQLKVKQDELEKIVNELQSSPLSRLRKK